MAIVKPVLVTDVKIPFHDAERSSSIVVIKIFGFDISRMSAVFQFLLLLSGVFIFFLLCGSVEENMFSNVPGFNFGWFMTVFELFGFAFIAFIEHLLANGRTFRRQAPLYNHFIVALSMTFARGLTNMSLQYLNYPSQVIFKSLKLIVVLLGSVFIYRKKYPLKEWISCIFLVLSAILFSLGDAHVSPRFSLMGIGVVVASLFFDALHSNSQEHVLQGFNAPMLELMIFGNLLAAVMSVIITFATGEFVQAINFCKVHPSIYAYFLLRTVLVYAGVLCFVAIIKRFGVVVATTVTTVRKVLSVVLSFVLFPKPFSWAYVVAGVMFFFGTYLNVIAKKSARPKHKDVDTSRFEYETVRRWFHLRHFWERRLKRDPILNAVCR